MLEMPPPEGLRVDLLGLQRLVFDDGSPARAASAIARLGTDWLIVQDDANQAAWRCGTSPLSAAGCRAQEVGAITEGEFAGASGRFDVDSP